MGRGSKTNEEGECTEGYWAGGKFFEGPAPEGVLHHQKDLLVKGYNAHRT